jgi:hypothetical protein
MFHDIIILEINLFAPNPPAGGMWQMTKINTVKLGNTVCLINKLQLKLNVV